MRQFLKGWMSVLMAAVMILLPVLGNAPRAAALPSLLCQVGGKFYASGYGSWKLVAGGSPNTGTGSQTLTIVPGANGSCLPTAADGTVIPNALQNGSGSLYTPIIVGQGTANQETVTPTAVSLAAAPCTITASFSYTHGPGDVIVTGDAGLDEAINSMPVASGSGGVVVVDNLLGATDAEITAANLYPGVTVEDIRNGGPVFWTPVGTGTAAGVPVALTSSTVGDALTGTAALATGGHYTNSNPYYPCIAYVDITGQEGACSPTYNFTPATGSTNQIGFTTPAASTGMVGYTIYISLTNGSYTSMYKVPLVTQPTAIGSYPVANGVCTLTTLETVTPACALKNSTYGQSGSHAVVSALTLNTSPIAPKVTVVSTTSIYQPNAGGQTVYQYTPTSHVGLAGMPSAYQAFTISAADATTVPSVIGTVNFRPGFMNKPGQTIRVCGNASTSASTGTIQDIQFQWDAMGQNTAGKGVKIGDLTVTETATSVLQLDFCETFQTTVASASATGGTIAAGQGYITSTIASLSAAAAGGNTVVGGTGSLNLADDARLNIIYLHTTGTDGTAVTLNNVTIQVL
jgi:hypothetical protein